MCADLLNLKDAINDLKTAGIDYLHIDILKHAVDLYRISVSGGTYASQQAQNQNIGGTNSNNEGYQS